MNSALEAGALVSRLFHCLDRREYPEAAELFATDGFWLRAGEKLVGPSAVAAALRRRPESLATCHLVSNLVADVDPGTGIRAFYYITVFEDPSAEAGKPALLGPPSAIFRSSDTLVESAGRWRFASRVPQLIFKRG